MNSKLKFLAVSCGLMTGIWSCKKVDTTAPIIEEVSLNGQTEEVEASAGSTMRLGATFKDEEALGSYKIDIHDAFDGHSHGKTHNARFSFQKTTELEGELKTISEDIALPSDAAAGPYHCIVRLLDEDGNEASPKEIRLVVNHPDQPVVVVTSPDFSEEVEVNRGSTLTLQGEITDENDIAEIVIMVVEHEGHSHGKRQSEVLYEEDFDLPGANDLSWNFNQLQTQNKEIIIPASAETGEYELIITVLDSEENMTVWEGEVHVE